LVRPPANLVTVVRAGLALTGKAPTSPQATLARPIPTKSRLMLSSIARSSAVVRQVAALWLKITITSVRAVVTTVAHSDPLNQCRRHVGSPALTGPSCCTP
jgi:hypothetical protein